MNTEYKPGYFLTIVSVVTLLVPALLMLIFPKSRLAGSFFLLMAFGIGASFVARFLKYIVTDTCLKVVSWNGTIKSQIEYNEIKLLFLHKGTRQTGQTLKVDQDVETLVIDLTSGETARFDLTPIDKSEELVALIRSKMEG